MALWGEGDPRWIVEERADAKNVNNWHWTEKNATTWSKSTIQNLLTGLSNENDKYYFEITEVSKLEGEAVANNRKGKLIFFYEWELEADWKGFEKSNTDSKFTGKIQIANLSEENSADELEIGVSCTESGQAAYNIKEFVRVDSASKIRQALALYISGLVTEYGKDLILPTKTGDGNSQPLNSIGQPPSAGKPSKAQFNNTITIRNKEADSSDICLCKFNTTEIFLCSPADLYRIFVTPEAVTAFTRGQVVLEPEPGGKFSLFNGEIKGSFIELDESKLVIRKRWWKKKWPENVISEVDIKFSAHPEGTLLSLEQRQIPNYDLDDTSRGWTLHYFNAIKQTFGYGKSVF